MTTPRARPTEMLASALLLIAATSSPFPELPARAVGVVVMPGVEPWGTFYEPGFDWSWAGTEEGTVHRFLVGPDAGSEYAPYFSPRNGNVANAFQLYVELPQQRTTYTIDHGPGAIERNARAFGVDVPVALVEVDVNDRRGGRGPHFVITGARIIDDKLGDRFMEARRSFDALVARNRASLTRALDAGEAAARGKLPGARIVGDVPAQDLVVYRPFWNAATKTVDVYFGYRIVAGVKVKSSPPDAHANTKHAPPPPIVVAPYSAAMGARYRVGERGVVREVEVFEPMTLEQRHVPWEDGLGHVAEARVKDDDHAELCRPSECGPRPGMPTERCADGSLGGNTGRCLSKNGRCGWEIRACPR
jgi:hypothetical protein